MSHAVEVHREITKPTVLRRNRRSRWLALACVPLAAFSAWSWITRPEFIWGAGLRHEAPARRDANVRFAMYLLVQRLESYRDSEGLYPSSLAALDEAGDSIEYSLIGDTTYELRAAGAAARIVYRSSQPIDELLGNSMALIQGRAP